MCSNYRGWVHAGCVVRWALQSAVQWAWTVSDEKYRDGTRDASRVKRACHVSAEVKTTAQFPRL